MSSKPLLYGLCLALVLPVRVLANIDAPAGTPETDPADKPLTQVSEPGVAETKPAPPRAEIDALVEAAAKRHGVELALVKAVVAAESAYDTRAVSRAGALGLMQIMPGTGADYGVTEPEKLFDPATNLDTGTRHIKRLLGKYKNDYGRVIMAYNAGEGVVDRTGSMVTYAETLSYTEAVVRHYRRNGGTKPTDEALAKSPPTPQAQGHSGQATPRPLSGPKPALPKRQLAHHSRGRPRAGRERPQTAAHDRSRDEKARLSPPFRWLWSTRKLTIATETFSTLILPRTPLRWRSMRS
jgi:hypothetical protein